MCLHQAGGRRAASFMLYMLRSQSALRVAGNQGVAATNRHDPQSKGGGGIPFRGALIQSSQAPSSVSSDPLCLLCLLCPLQHPACPREKRWRPEEQRDPRARVPLTRVGFFSVPRSQADPVLLWKRDKEASLLTNSPWFFKGTSEKMRVKILCRL